MMTVNPTRRITVPEILLHPWLRDQRMREEVNMLISHVETDENAPPLNVLINRREADPEMIPGIMIKRARVMV